MAQEHDGGAMAAQLAGQAELIAQQRLTISELETPVIQVWDGILALPIVGSLDTGRTQEMNEALLQRIILDIKQLLVIACRIPDQLVTTIVQHAGCLDPLDAFSIQRVSSLAAKHGASRTAFRNRYSTEIQERRHDVLQPNKAVIHLPHRVRGEAPRRQDHRDIGRFFVHQPFGE